MLLIRETRVHELGNRNVSCRIKMKMEEVCMYYTDEKLRQLQNALVEILEYVKRVCEQNDLQYLLIGGTALGAKRHEGFVPWDDDIDIGLPRSDYEKLVTILRKQNNGYILQDEYNEPNYFCPFVKVRKEGTIFKEKISVGLYKNNGIYIDVFPIDTLSSRSSLKTIISMWNIKLLNHALRFRYCRSIYNRGAMLSKLKDWVLYIPFALIPRDCLLNMLKKNMTAQNKEEKKYAANFAGTNKIEKEIMDYSTFFPVREIMFEGHLYPCPRDIDVYLRNLYGDFMKLPPIEKRKTHEPLELKF